MISEAEFKTCIYEVVQGVRGELADTARRIFQQEFFLQAIDRGDAAQVTEGIRRGLAMWFPDSRKVFLLVVSGVLGEVAMEQYELLKSRFQLKSNIGLEEI